MVERDELRWRPEVRACPCCDSSDHMVLGRRGGEAHRAGLGVETNVVRCRACHAVYPRPALIPLGNPYDAYSSDEYFRTHDARAKVAYGRVIARAGARILGRVGTLLELGCGRGELLQGAQAEGWTVCGVDMTPGFVPAHDRFPVEIAPVETAKSLDRNYDVVLLGAILEHLYAPRECLTRIRRALVPGGLVFIDVPNECSLWTLVGNAYMRLRGRDWAVNLSPTFSPFHVVGFCPRSLRRLLIECGFTVVELKTQRWQEELPRASGIWGQAEALGADLTLSVGARIGMGAGITCWARAGA